MWDFALPKFSLHFFDSFAYSVLVIDTESLQYASVYLVKNSSAYIQNGGNSADPGGPLIALKNGTPIIYGWFFYKLTQSPDLVTQCIFVGKNLF